MIKVLICIDTLTGGGAERQLIEYLKKINCYLFDITLVLIHYEGIYVKEIPEFVRCISAIDFYKDPSVSEIKYDVEIAFLEGESVKFVAHRKTSSYKIAWIHINLYEYNWSKRFFNSLDDQELNYNQMDHIVFVSENCRNGFLKLFTYPKTHTSVIHNQMDIMNIINLSEAYVVPKSKFTICAVGRLSSEKNFGLLISSVHKLINEGYDLKLWIIGEGCEEKYINELINDLDISNHVELLGFIKNPYPYMLAADIIVSTSYVEGWPLVLYEALCLKKTIIATHSGGSDEILEYGKYGMLVDNNVENVADGIKTFFNEPHKMIELQTEISVKLQYMNIYNTIIRIETLLLNASRKRKEGYGMDGFMKKTIELFEESRLSGDNDKEYQAEELLNKCLNACKSWMPISYYSGLCGVAYGIEYLIKNSFFEGNSDEILEELDSHICLVVCDSRYLRAANIDEMKGVIKYLKYRIQNKSKNVVKFKKCVYVIEGYIRKNLCE